MQADKIIAIETSSPTGSVAIAEGPTLLAERAFPTQTEHGRELIPTLDALCREAGWPTREIRQCYVSIGPGSFTGLRVAVTFARTAALAGVSRICAVPTLAVIAENCVSMASPPQRVAVILDAKRSQVFGAVFEMLDGEYRTIVGARLADPRELLTNEPRDLAVMGEGISFHHEAVQSSGVGAILDESLWQPQAAKVHRLGWRMAGRSEFTEARSLVPLYIRRPEAEELWEKRAANR